MMAKLRLQGSRVALLLEPDTQKLFDALARFRDQKVDVGTCAERENEMGFTLTTMMMTLQQQHWNVKWLEPNPGCTTGMRVLVRDDAPESTKSAAMALGKVLITLGVMSPKLKPFDVFERPKGNAVILGTAWEPSTADSVLLMVMAHPLGSQLP